MRRRWRRRWRGFPLRVPFEVPRIFVRFDILCASTSVACFLIALRVGGKVSKYCHGGEVGCSGHDRAGAEGSSPGWVVRLRSDRPLNSEPLWPTCAIAGRCVGAIAMIAARQVRLTRAPDPPACAAVVAGKAGQCAFFPGGIVSMMDRIATTTMNTLNISAIIAAARMPRLS